MISELQFLKNNLPDNLVFLVFLPTVHYLEDTYHIFESTFPLQYQFSFYMQLVHRENLYYLHNVDFFFLSLFY